VVVLAFHKAVGLVTTHHDEHGRETVYQRLRAVLPRPLRDVAWHAIGRLDKDTSGLLLFTDDGALVHHATQPSTGLPKTYRVLAKGLLGEAELAQLRAGVELSGGLGRSAPAEARVVAHQIATSWLELTLREGKNREVRRMLLAVGQPGHPPGARAHRRAHAGAAGGWVAGAHGGRGGGGAGVSGRGAW
jgi:pseudouridine synthase